MPGRLVDRRETWRFNGRQHGRVDSLPSVAQHWTLQRGFTKRNGLPRAYGRGTYGAERRSLGLLTGARNGSRMAVALRDNNARRANADGSRRVCCQHAATAQNGAYLIRSAKNGQHKRATGANMRGTFFRDRASAG